MKKINERNRAEREGHRGGGSGGKEREWREIEGVE